MKVIMNGVEHDIVPLTAPDSPVEHDLSGDASDFARKWEHESSSAQFAAEAAFEAGAAWAKAKAELEADRLAELIAAAKHAAETHQYTIGTHTFERVFRANGMTNLHDLQAVMDAVERAFVQILIVKEPKFQLGDRVRKHSGAWWQGVVVGTYTTLQTPIGYCVQMETPTGNGPVQIYPEAALEHVPASAPSVAVKHEDLVKRLLDIGSMCEDQNTARTAYDAVTALSAQVQDVAGTHPDDLSVDQFASAMKAKLAKKRDEGRGGWDDKDDCSQLHLSQLLREHVEKGEPLDVGNFAMMLHQRGERISSLLDALQGE